MTPRQPAQAGRPGAHLRLVASRAVIATPPPEPVGLTRWDVAFLLSIAEWPLPLQPGQRAALRWIAERARVA